MRNHFAYRRFMRINIAYVMLPVEEDGVKDYVTLSCADIGECDASALGDPTSKYMIELGERRFIACHLGADGFVVRYFDENGNHKTHTASHVQIDRHIFDTSQENKWETFANQYLSGDRANFDSGSESGSDPDPELMPTQLSHDWDPAS